MLYRDVAANVSTIEKREKEDERQRMMDRTLKGSPYIPHRLLLQHDRVRTLHFPCGLSSLPLLPTPSRVPHPHLVVFATAAAATAAAVYTASFVAEASAAVVFADATASVSEEAADMILHTSD